MSTLDTDSAPQSSARAGWKARQQQLRWRRANGLMVARVYLPAGKDFTRALVAAGYLDDGTADKDAIAMAVSDLLMDVLGLG